MIRQRTRYMSVSRAGTVHEKVEIITDRKQIERMISQVLSRADTFIDICLDKNTLNGQRYWVPGQTMKKNVTARYVTEVTHENLQNCKELSQIGQIYHVDGIRGNFAVTDTEYIGAASLGDSETVSQLIYSNSKQIVEQHEFVFETLREKGIPALHRIKEIEELVLAGRTKVIYGEEQIRNTIVSWQRDAQKHWNICVDSAVPNFSMSEQIRKGYDDAKVRGVKIRYITEITKANFALCQQITNYAEVRHLAGLIGNFVVSEKEYLGESVSKDFFSHLVYSNNKEIVQQQNYIFENLWNNAIPQEIRLRQIKEGIQPEENKILSDPADIEKLYKNLLKSVRSEITLIVSTNSALLRQQKIGIFELIKKAAIERNVKANLIIPRNEVQNQDPLEHKTRSEADLISNYHMIEQLQSTSSNIHVRKYSPSIDQRSKINSTVLLVDRQYSLLIDLKDDLKQDFIEAIGSASYSDSRSRTQSYCFLFDSLWRQADLFRQLEVKTIELGKLNALQNEFINVAAHELKTPTQAIIGYAEMMENSSERNLIYESAITRNAQRLYMLATDILDVARIESQTLKLDRLNFDLNQEIESVINDIIGGKEWEKLSESVKLVFEPEVSLIVFADNHRVHQVINNIVSNALKFTEKGTISIVVEKNSSSKEAIVTVTDTGIGIDKELLPRIFSKFSTRSKTGTGLGLFISKALVEAHGGQIEGYNNLNGKGATFKFTLPLPR